MYRVAGTGVNYVVTVKRRLSFTPWDGCSGRWGWNLIHRALLMKWPEIATEDLQKCLGDGKYQICDDLAAGNHASS
jgi:hypothetical protein